MNDALGGFGREPIAGGAMVVDLADEFGMRTIDALDVCARIGIRDAAGGTVLSSSQVEQFRSAAGPGGSPPSVAETAPGRPFVGQPPVEQLPFGQQSPFGQQAQWAPPATGSAGGGGPGFPMPVGGSGKQKSSGLKPGAMTVLAGIGCIVATIVVMQVAHWIFFYPIIIGAVMVFKGLGQMMSGGRGRR